MRSDSPIVAEVRRARAKIAARFGYDLHKYCQYLMKKQEEEAKAKVAAGQAGKQKLTEDKIDQTVARATTFKAKVRKPRKNQAEVKSIPLAKVRRRLGV